MKNIASIVVTLIFTLTAGILPAAAEMRLGYVDAARLLDEAPQAKDATNRLKDEFASREEEIALAQDKVKRLEEALQRDGAVMSEDERKKQTLDILSRKRELRRMQDEFREDVNIRRNDAIGNLQGLIKHTIEEIGSAQKFDLIFFDGIAYANSGLDITDQVLDGLKKRYQGAAAGSKGK
ncbi:MAG: OmpH family outer membrane protein [Gammaproteobacteria bacterium]|nr:OmpH family outer membrane protein [Gammaproteobacteria bacterium]